MVSAPLNWLARYAFDIRIKIAHKIVNIRKANRIMFEWNKMKKKNKSRQQQHWSTFQKEQRERKNEKEKKTNFERLKWMLVRLLSIDT